MWHGLPNAIVKAIPPIVLLAAAAFFALSGIVFASYGLAFTGSGADLGAVAFGAALIVGAGALVVVTVGIGRERQWAIHVALAVTGLLTLACAWVAQTAFNAHGLSAGPDGRFHNDYDTGAMALAFAGIPFAIAMVCLVVDEFRLWKANKHASSIDSRRT
jgi:hypothetical protein